MTEEDKSKGPHRPIRSFVLRQGRITESQGNALDKYWASYGLSLGDGMLDPAASFAREADLVLEIGFGNGQSLLKMMEDEPDKDFIGIEVHRPGVGSLINGAQRLGLLNLKVYCEDGVQVLEQVIPDNSLSRVQLFFPDPWHKLKHKKRRIVQAEFVQLLRRKLKVKGVFHMATDWEDYAQHMMKVMSSAPGFVNQLGTDQYSPRPPHRGLTKFEQRGQRLGHGVWDLLFERKD